MALLFVVLRFVQPVHFCPLRFSSIHYISSPLPNSASPRTLKFEARFITSRPLASLDFESNALHAATSIVSTYTVPSFSNPTRGPIAPSSSAPTNFTTLSGPFSSMSSRRPWQKPALQQMDLAFLLALRVMACCAQRLGGCGLGSRMQRVGGKWCVGEAGEGRQQKVLPGVQWGCWGWLAGCEVFGRGLGWYGYV